MVYSISLFENAVDELKAAEMHAQSFFDWRDDNLIPDIEKLCAFKHMIKHLSSAWELLMKYRIQGHDPKMIFINPDQITDEKLKSGDFQTVKYMSAIRILNSYGIDCPFSNLKKLHIYRNQIEHYQIEVSFSELIQTAADAIGELIMFCSCYITSIIADREIMYQAGDIVIHLFTAKKKFENILSTRNYLG